MNNYQQDSISINDRILAPTPRFFRVIRNIGLVLGTVGTTILTAGATLPVAITTVAGYLVTAGAVAAAVSQTTVDWKVYQRGQFVGI